MGSGERIMHYANFNITYGPDETPMLTHFEDIIWPAFLSGFQRGRKNEYPRYYLSDVAVKEIGEDLALVGNYIKETQYDIRTTVQDGELVPTPSSVPTAPYSRFIIFLRNHRMILVRNESQSPDIRSFQATVRSLLHNYVSGRNRKIKEKDKRLPQVLVNIVDIPLSEDIETALKNVQKINWLKIRFFPLNNDISPIPLAEDIDRQMKKMKSSHAHVQFASPGSKEEVKNLIGRSSGLAVSTLEVLDAGGNKTKIKEDQFTTSKKIPFGRDILPEDDGYIIEQAKKDAVVTVTSGENEALFERFKDKLRMLIG